MISLSTLSFSTITSYYFTSTLYDVMLKFIYTHEPRVCDVVVRQVSIAVLYTWLGYL